MCPTLERRENTAEAGRICANGVRQKVRVLSARRTFGESAFGEFAFRAQLQTKASHFLGNRKNGFLRNCCQKLANPCQPALEWTQEIKLERTPRSLGRAETIFGFILVQIFWMCDILQPWHSLKRVGYIFYEGNYRMLVWTAWTDFLIKKSIKSK